MLKSLVVTSALFSSVTPFFAAAQDDPPPPEGVRVTSRATADYAELWAKQQERARRHKSGLTGNTATSKPKTIRTYLPACAGNWPGKGGTTLCPGASTLCLGTPDPTDFAFWVFSAPAGATAQESWTATGELICLGDTDPDDPPPVIPVLTGEDFQRLPLPASPIVVQPPNHRTLVNVPTNLYADSDTVTLPTTILGQPVRVRATPKEFRWTYGDGGSLSTADAGAAYPVLRTAHIYREAGARRVGLTTVYSGKYSVNGGPWLPVDGVATVASPVSTLDVISAENRLVAGSDE